MIIQDFGTLQMVRSKDSHYGQGQMVSLTSQVNGTKINTGIDPSKNLLKTGETEEKSFQSFLMEAVNSVNNQQNQVSQLQEKIITNPEEVDIHDVTIAMSKARMSLNLAQTVIDRLVTGWNEITTTR